MFDIWASSWVPFRGAGFDHRGLGVFRRAMIVSSVGSVILILVTELGWIGWGILVVGVSGLVIYRRRSKTWAGFSRATRRYISAAWEPVTSRTPSYLRWVLGTAIENSDRDSHPYARP